MNLKYYAMKINNIREDYKTWEKWVEKQLNMKIELLCCLKKFKDLIW